MMIGRLQKKNRVRFDLKLTKNKMELREILEVTLIILSLWYLMVMVFNHDKYRLVDMMIVFIYIRLIGLGMDIDKIEILLNDTLTK